MMKKNALERFVEQLLPDPLKPYAIHIVAYLVFIASLIVMGWLFGNRFLLSLGLGSLLIYVIVMIAAVVHLVILKK